MDKKAACGFDAGACLGKQGDRMRRSRTKRSAPSRALQPYLEELLRHVLELQHGIDKLRNEDEAQDQRALLDTLCTNLLVELNGKQVHVLRDPVNARLLEQLLGLLLANGSGTTAEIAGRTASVISCFLGGPSRASGSLSDAIAPWMQPLLTDANGSHVLQKLLWRLTEPDLNQVCTKAMRDDVDSDARTCELAAVLPPMQIVKDTLEALCDWWFAPSDTPELVPLNQRGCWFATLMHPSGTHVLRAFLLAISALPARRFGPVQCWHAHFLDQFMSGTQPIASTPFYPELIESKIAPALARLPVASRRRLARCAPASATLQVLLLATLHVFRRTQERAPDLNPDGNTNPNHLQAVRNCWEKLISGILETARRDLLEDPAASRLLELALRCARVKLGPYSSPASRHCTDLLPFYETHMAGADRLRRLVMHPQANYCVQGLLYGADVVLLQRMLLDDELLESVIATGEGWANRSGRDRSGVVYTALKAVLHIGAESSADAARLVERTIDAVERGLGMHATDMSRCREQIVPRLMQVLFASQRRRIFSRRVTQQSEDDASSASNDGATEPPTHRSIYNSLLVQLLVHHSTLVREGFMQLAPDEFATIANDAVACHALEAYLGVASEHPAMGDRVRAQLRQLIPLTASIAASPSGVRVLEKMVVVMEHDLEWHRLVVEQLADASSKLVETPHGARCLRLFQVRLWRNHPKLWLVAQQKRLTAKRALSDILSTTPETPSAVLASKRKGCAAANASETAGCPVSVPIIPTVSTGRSSRSEHTNHSSISASEAPCIPTRSAVGARDSSFRSSLMRLDPMRLAKSTATVAKSRDSESPMKPRTEQGPHADLSPILDVIHRASTATRNRNA